MAQSTTHALKQAAWSAPKVHSGRPGSVSHPTRERLIEVTLQLIDAEGVDAVTSDRILRSTGISKGSLYHHFTDFSELIEAAMARQFSRTVDWSIAGVAEVMTKARTHEELFSLLGQLLVETHSPVRAVHRLRRAMLAGITVGNPRFQQTLAGEQDRMTQAMTELIHQAQKRGWITSEVDAHASAVLVQAFTLGLVVNDIASKGMEPLQWARLMERLIVRVFSAESGSYAKSIDTETVDEGASQPSGAQTA